MRKKPDLLLIAALLLGLGLVFSTYSMGQVKPEEVARSVFTH